MELKKHKVDGVMHLSPTDAKDLPMFKHCTDGHISVTEKAYKQQFRLVFNAHKIFCTIIPYNPVYLVHIDDVMSAVDVARVNYGDQSMAFGMINPDELKNKFLNLPHPEGDLHVAAVMQVLNDVETQKMVGTANSGLNWIKGQVRRSRRAVERDE